MKKLFLLIAVLGISFGNSFANRWVGGTYQGSFDDETGCHIFCTRSDLFCYYVSRVTIQNDPPTTCPFDEWQPFDQSYYGSYVKVETLDANQNTVNTYIGYFYGMNTEINPDGSKAAHIVLDKQPRN